MAHPLRDTRTNRDSILPEIDLGWNKVMKAWGSGDEKVVAKNFELLFNAARSEEQAKDPALPRRWQSKSTFGMQRSRAWCGTPPILGVVNMVGTRNFTCYMGAL